MSTTQWEAVLTMPVDEDRDHIQGAADAAVILWHAAVWARG